MPRIVIISDTHERHEQVAVPDGDILIHCGDFTNMGSPIAIEKFLVWFTAHPHSNKIFISGNHEVGLDVGPTRKGKLELIKSFQDKHKNLFYLENSEITIDGFKIYGSPHTPVFFDWAWNIPRGPQIAKIWSLIPDDVNILLTHGQPYGILDIVPLYPRELRDPHQGCEELAKRVFQLKNLKLSAGGHLHTSGGKIEVHDGIIFANGAICTEQYAPTNPPVVIDL